MKKALILSTIIVFGGLLLGTILKVLDLDAAKVVLPLFMFLLAFILMPFFLFYRYDEKLQKKNQEKAEE